MPAKKRFKTKYVGVYYIESDRAGRKPERIYYISYRKDGKVIEEKAGKQFENDMTPARASGVRARRMQGQEASNREQREIQKKMKEKELCKWTINRIWDEYRTQKAENKGIQIDELRFNKHIKTKFGNKEPHNILQLDIDRLRINSLKTQSPQSVKHVLSLLKRIIRFGVAKGFCQDLPFRIEMPKVHNQKTEDLTDEQLQRLLKVLDTDYDVQACNFMRLALFTGMRRGELLKLQWKDIDFQKAFICIVDPKGGPSQTIPLNTPARDVLESHPKNESDFIFPGKDGGQRLAINANVKRLRDLAGLPRDFRPLHGLRHVFATLIASSGQVDMFTLQKLLCHKDFRVTQRYAHLRDEALQRAASVADDIFGEVVKKK